MSLREFDFEDFEESQLGLGLRRCALMNGRRDARRSPKDFWPDQGCGNFRHQLPGPGVGAKAHKVAGRGVRVRRYPDFTV